ncbi:MAG TPA: patatin-like phospholipase family protein [Streptosporangiaceae bacterium]
MVSPATPSSASTASAVATPRSWRASVRCFSSCVTAGNREVLRGIAATTRVVLLVEGGSSRGAYSSGMTIAIEELGLLPSFDAVYGSSAGALNAAWLLCARAESTRSRSTGARTSTPG